MNRESFYNKLCFAIVIILRLNKATFHCFKFCSNSKVEVETIDSFQLNKKWHRNDRLLILRFLTRFRESIIICGHQEILEIYDM